MIEKATTSGDDTVDATDDGLRVNLQALVYALARLSSREIRGAPNTSDAPISATDPMSPEQGRRHR